MTTLFLRTLLIIGATAAIPAFAVTRNVTISAPATAKPGAPIQVTIMAVTDASDGEQVGFFHAEYSTDNGKTWNTRYADKAGRSVTRTMDFPAGPEGSNALVRVRVAFRGGKAGDVDFTALPIAWNESWAKWGTPPAKLATIKVTAR